MQTLRWQQVPTAHTLPRGQSALEPQSFKPSHGVFPLTQKPRPPVMEAQTQLPPGPQGPKAPQVLPVHELKEHAPLVQAPEGHCRKNDEIRKCDRGRRGRKGTHVEIAAPAVVRVGAGVDALVAARRLGLVFALALAQLLGGVGIGLFAKELDGEVVRGRGAVAREKELRDGRKLGARLHHAAEELLVAGPKLLAAGAEANVVVVAALAKGQVGHLDAVLGAATVGAGRQAVGHGALARGAALAGRRGRNVGGDHVEALGDGNVALELGCATGGDDDVEVGRDGEVELAAADDARGETALASEGKGGRDVLVVTGARIGLAVGAMEYQQKGS